MSESRNHSNILTFKHSNIRTLFKRFFAGGHRGVVTPVPIPNTEVKRSIAEGSVGVAHARVGRCRLFYCLTARGVSPFDFVRAVIAFWRFAFAPLGRYVVYLPYERVRVYSFRSGCF